MVNVTYIGEFDSVIVEIDKSVLEIDQGETIEVSEEEAYREGGFADQPDVWKCDPPKPAHLSTLKVDELREKATALGIDTEGLKKADLVEAIESAG